MRKEFKPIAMKCNQEQFDAIRPKLKKAGCKIDSSNGFETYPYLVNNKIGNKNNITNYCKSDANSYNRTVYKEWNEKLFLECCGIETTPTLEEVKEYFKDAKEVRCLADKKDIYDISNLEITECDYVFLAQTKRGKPMLRVYDKDEKQFAEIISYKDKDYTITKDQLNEVLQSDKPKDKLKEVLELDKQPLTIEQRLERIEKHLKID